MAHVGESRFRFPGLGPFAGLNVLPKCTPCRHTRTRSTLPTSARLQAAFRQTSIELRLYDGQDRPISTFHTVPHYGRRVPCLKSIWAGRTRPKSYEGGAHHVRQDAGSKLMLYTEADIQPTRPD